MLGRNFNFFHFVAISILDRISPACVSHLSKPFHAFRGNHPLPCGRKCIANKGWNKADSSYPKWEGTPAALPSTRNVSISAPAVTVGTYWSISRRTDRIDETPPHIFQNFRIVIGPLRVHVRRTALCRKYCRLQNCIACPPTLSVKHADSTKMMKTDG